MAERPLLILPAPENVAAPRGFGGGAKLRFPARDRQIARHAPQFKSLREALSREGGVLELRNDPTSLSPDRVIVFEIGGSLANIAKAVARIDGLEFMVEQESEFAADEDFAVVDTRKGREGQDRDDKPIASRLYLAMPDVAALQALVSLWERWEREEPFDKGYAPFAHLFEQLHDLRPWGPLDRIPDETLRYWEDEAHSNPGRPVRTEVELWFHANEGRRGLASRVLREAVADLGGRVIHEATITEIAYHGALVDLPATAVPDLTARRLVRLVLADEVMFLRPQSMLSADVDLETVAAGARAERVNEQASPLPIAAILDGVPVQQHTLLADRILLDDPDDLQSRAIVARRRHGTAMASLIIHGDLNAAERPLGRPLYVRPLMMAPAQGREQSDGDRLLIDTIYRAILRMKGSEGEDAAAPSVFLVNLSMCDLRRPFTGTVSPLARLLDFLAERYNLLFLVSGGNVTDELEIPGYDSWHEFEQASVEEREKAVLAAVNRMKHERTILSPAESLNSITIGAQHHDNVLERMNTAVALDPYHDNTLPNVSSGLGLGYRRAIKPEIYLPGGREHVRVKRTGGGLVVEGSAPQRLFGLSAAAPDAAGTGRLDFTALSDGTSSATALATRAAHLIFDALMDREGGSLLVDLDPQFYAVVVKALLIHRARWNGNGDSLKDICGPVDTRQSVERAENACRFIGFGVPRIEEALECSPQRATLVGYGELPAEGGHSFRVPLPGCLERVTDPRSLTVTIAWFSPVKAGHQSYRCCRFEAAPLNSPMEVLGVERLKLQPADATVKRGAIFHEHFYGANAVPFLDDGHLALRVWCKEDAGGVDVPIKYGIAVTIEAETPIPVYEEIRARLRVAPRP